MAPKLGIGVIAEGIETLAQAKMLVSAEVVSYETIRRWCDKFGKQFAQRVKQTRPVPGTTWHLDEVFVHVGGEPYTNPNP